jgi:hypothetical protein
MDDCGRPWLDEHEDALTSTHASTLRLSSFLFSAE